MQKALSVVLEQDKMQNLNVKSEGAISTEKVAKIKESYYSDISANNVPRFCP